eukprot:gb/GEZN01005389.1/.p2 GENE.gb/GEZN01005389.1/~~gb/GEZN01005389.1/.p2  ORF type:complete len:247 (-),score=10.90 gb/GEZN01005389.1/:7-747(-)
MGLPRRRLPLRYDEPIFQYRWRAQLDERVPRDIVFAPMPAEEWAARSRNSDFGVFPQLFPNVWIDPDGQSNLVPSTRAYNALRPWFSSCFDILITIFPRSYIGPDRSQTIDVVRDPVKDELRLRVAPPIPPNTTWRRLHWQLVHRATGHKAMRPLACEATLAHIVLTPERWPQEIPRGCDDPDCVLKPGQENVWQVIGTLPQDTKRRDQQQGVPEENGHYGALAHVDDQFLKPNFQVGEYGPTQLP